MPLPPVFVEFLGNSAGVRRAMSDVRRESRRTADETEGAFARTGRLSKAAIAGIGIAAAGVAVHTVKMAGDFQVQMTRVRTGAGEAAQNMQMVGQGVLAMAGEVGQSTTELTSGLYMVESAGYHGADALKVLKASAMGAKVGAADLKTTTDAVTTAMNAYKTGAGSATSVTNALIATEAEGKTNLEALAGSMSSILPVSAAAHVKLNEVLGAMATMTAQGTPAAVAATYLRQTIGQLSNPSGKAAREMSDLGLSAVKVGQNLGKNGLASTLTMLTDAIQKKMGPAGTVLIEHLQKAAKNTTAYQKELANLSPSQQTYIGALATMVGGTKSMQAALQLTGPHMADFKKNTAGIAEHVKAGGKSVEGWAEVQKNYNQKMAEAKASLESVQIQIGQYLLPVFSTMVTWIGKAVTWMAKHKSVAEALAIVIGGVLVAAVTALSIALWNAAVAAEATGIPEIIIGVTLLIAAIVVLVTHWRQVWDFIKRISADVAGAVVAAWNWVASGTASIWHSITNWVTGAWHSVASFFSTAWHMVADPIVNAWHWVQRTTAAVWNAITGFFKKWWPLLLVIFAPPIALLLAIWNHFHTQIIGAAKTVWNAVLAFFSMIWNGIKAAAGVVWLGIQIAVIAPMTATWHALVGVWNTVSGWLHTAWNGIRTVAVATWLLIKAAMINPIVSAWHSVTSTVGKISTAVSHGLSLAWSAVKDIGSRFLTIGKNIVMGIIHGVENSGGSLLTSLKNLASNALDAAKNFLGIKSPSRKFAEIGAYVGAGLVQGLEGTASQVRSASNRISQMLYKEFGSSSHRHLQALVKSDGEHLNRLAKQRDEVAAKLKTANKNLATLQADWKKTRDSVAASVMQNVSVVTALPEGSVQLTASDVVANMKDQVAKAKAFAAELQVLRKKGLSADLIAQIASAGVDQGGATAAALATASKDQIAAINSSQKQAKSAANSVGAATADAMYKSGIQSAQGLVKGLRAQEKNIQKEMDRIAKSMAAAIKKALKIKSPSALFAEIGDFVSRGLAVGITGGSQHAVAAATTMAGAVTAAGRPAVPTLPGVGRLGGYGGAGARDMVLENTTIIELDGDVLFKNMQRRSLQHEKRNRSNGLSLKIR